MILQAPVGEEYEIADDKNEWKIFMEAHNFDPEEIYIQVNNNELTLHARKGTGSRGKRGLSDREFTKKFIIPDGVNIKQLKSTLSSNGILVVEAPKRGADSRRESERIIQVRRASEIIAKFQNPRHSISERS